MTARKELLTDGGADGGTSEWTISCLSLSSLPGLGTNWLTAEVKLIVDWFLGRVLAKVR